MKSAPTVIDIFCGAGGFSEGFRQQGYVVKLGIDRWQPAIATFNHNFEVESKVRDVLEFNKSVGAIEALPDTDVILGSPPCVSFSSSNISGKADKSLGITLTQIFLRIVAVKKWKRGSILKAWFMENVPRSIKHLAAEYTFEDLGLADWALENRYGSSKVAIRLEGNQAIVNSADYGSAQTRKRVISGEIISKKSFVVPATTHSEIPQFEKGTWRTLKDTIRVLPDPSARPSVTLQINDPNYPEITIGRDELSDHFYDTGLYESEWKLSQYLKNNHPYMGRMSFPENELRPSRTVTATKIGSSREALIYKSGYPRIGDGEYRTATVREAACLMGFPITYQFKGSEGTKWRLVGNAVCPSVSRALARQVLNELGLEVADPPVVQAELNLKDVDNLNTFSARRFDKPKKKRANSRFRRHPFKDGNVTVTLSNYDIEKSNGDVSRWITSVQYGSGDGFPTFRFPDDFHEELEPLVRAYGTGPEFIEQIEKDLIRKTAPSATLQALYEAQESTPRYLEPTQLIDELASIINGLGLEKQFFRQNGTAIFEGKKAVPAKQLFALYAINRLSSKANG